VYFIIILQPSFLFQYKDAEDTELVLLNRQLAATQKSELLDLFNGKKRPNINSDQLYIVPSSFVSDWRKFIRFVVASSYAPLLVYFSYAFYALGVLIIIMNLSIHFDINHHHDSSYDSRLNKS